MADLVIDYISGLCPVQSEGTVCGIPYYFRSRHENWTFSVGSDPLMDDIESLNFWVSGLYRNGDPEQAGYMPNEEALTIINECVNLYLKVKGLGFEHDE